MKTIKLMFVLCLLVSCASTQLITPPADYLLGIDAVMRFPRFIPAANITSCSFETGMSKQTFAYRFKKNGLLEGIDISRQFTSDGANSPYTMEMQWDDSHRLVKIELKSILLNREFFIITEFYYKDQSSLEFDHVIEQDGTVVRYKKTEYTGNQISRITAYLVKSVGEKPAATAVPYEISSYEYEHGLITRIIREDKTAAIRTEHSYKYVWDKDNRVNEYTATEQNFDLKTQNRYQPQTYRAVFQ
ncbi:MAG: hypothetical protein JW904_02925 [Spirochaetales bacterium]|nr:hypothetical protein [Spirochaetales bacterium]